MNYSYVFLYILSNVLGTYSIGKLFGIFLGAQFKSKKAYYISYVTFYLVTTLTHLLINIPFIMFLANIMGMLGLTLAYERNIQKKILAVVYVYFIIVGVETAIALISGYTNLNLFGHGDYDSIVGLLSIKIVTYMVALFLEKFGEIQKGERVPLSYWFCLFFVPTSSIYIILMTLNSAQLANSFLTIEIVLFLVINFAVFFLYDRLLIKIAETTEKQMLLQEQSSYLRQFELMKLSVESIHGLQHDLRNHFTTIQLLLKDSDYAGADRYVNEIAKLTNIEKLYVNTGNHTLDSILNFKIFEAEQLGIKVSANVYCPSDLELNAFDMTVIFGNIFDNAFESSKNKMVYLKIRYDRGRLIIKMTNDYERTLRFDKNRKIISTKKDKNNHGYGLKNVEKVLQKYEGTMDINSENNIFSVFIMLYTER